MSIIRVAVTPGARKEHMETIAEGSFRISVKEVAAANLANERVLELLALHFHIPKARIRIRAGARSAHKRVEIIS